MIVSRRGGEGRGQAYSCAQGEMAAETHARGTDQACACWQTEEVIDGLVRVLVVGLESLLGWASC